MARELIWSPTSWEDLREIAAYIERHSPRYAAEVVRKIFSLCEHLALFPEASGICTEVDRSDIRQIHAYRYRIIFHLTDHAVEVIAIFHG